MRPKVQIFDFFDFFFIFSKPKGWDPRGSEGITWESAALSVFNNHAKFRDNRSTRSAATGVPKVESWEKKHANVLFWLPGGGGATGNHP